MLMSETLSVKSNIRDYSVYFSTNFSEIFSSLSLQKSFFIIDKNVFSLYRNQLSEVIDTGRFVAVEAVEQNKSLEYVKQLTRQLLSKNIRKNHTLVAIGGGIIQDITGFLATVLFRGVEWVFYPTTLLAQSDSCIGSKTSINVDEFKNQLGTFYPPVRIILDVGFLQTLKPADITSGLGEIIKVHLLDGPQSLAYISSHYSRKVTDVSLFMDFIRRSLAIKKKIIEQDEYDRDYRNILNYGHTFGHAIESVTDYGICHGQAVTVGMDMANFISMEQGFLDESWYTKMKVPLVKNYPVYDLTVEQQHQLISALKRDKKNIDGQLVAILTEGPGKMKKIKIPFDQTLREVLTKFQSRVVMNV